MKLKHIVSIITLMTMASCQEDFLDPSSISTYDLKYVYSNVDDARIGVNSIYYAFSQHAFSSRLANNMTGNTDVERQTGWRNTNDRSQIWNLDVQASNRDTDIVWTYAYRAIRDANISIEGINNSGNLNSSEDDIRITFNHLLGEAYTLRAYWYSMLIFHFGDIPYVTKAPVAGDNFFLPKTNRNEILANEIQNLIDVEENMQWAENLTYGIEQVNREYTLGMIARLALQRGGYYLTPDLDMVRDSDYLDYYEIAKNYSKKLIDLKDRALPTDFRQIFLNQVKFISPTNEDILFEVPFAIGFGDVGWNVGIDVDGGANASHNYGDGTSYMHMPSTYYMSFDSKDIRREVTCGLHKINLAGEYEHVGREQISQGKWSRALLDVPQGQQSSKGTGINWPMMRYSDVLLMYAEAENELNNGPTTEAQDALKRVRQRAFNAEDWSSKVDTYVADKSTSKEDFFDAIVDERAWEFGGEMIRKYELIRWGIYYEKVVETVEGLKKLADDAYAGTGDGPDYMYWKVDENGDFVVLNPDTKVLDAPDDSWTRESFLRGLYVGGDDLYRPWINQDYENYINGVKPGVVRYIFPIPIRAIESSQGELANDGYGFQL